MGKIGREEKRTNKTKKRRKKGKNDSPAKTFQTSDLPIHPSSLDAVKNSNLPKLCSTTMPIFNSPRSFLREMIPSDTYP